MQVLKLQLEKLISSLSAHDRDKVKNRLDDLISVYPFNEYEYIISSLLALDKITLDDYLEIRDEYIARNMYLYIFEISAPRGFGEQWAQGHLKELAPELIKPTRKLEENYSGEYDFLYPLANGKMIKIEVKASRAVDFRSQEPLYVKALALESKLPFDMNFQQVKPKCCDVFVWIGVWRDTIKYWVLSSRDVETNRYYSKGQHRGNTGEGQLHVRPAGGGACGGV
ncbi:MAG: hypothetical protein AAB496_01610, partial [Patescibacteria group bacterium]